MIQARRHWFMDIDIMQKEMERLLKHLSGSKPPAIRFSPAIWEPAIDIYETDNELMVIAELAGVKEEDIEIIVDREMFIIRGQRGRAFSTSGKSACHQMEIPSGPFERRINLGTSVDATKARAYHEDGLVRVLLPKASAERSTTVKIRTS